MDSKPDRHRPNSQICMNSVVSAGSTLRVWPDNARGLLSQPDVDGALVGGASLDAQSFEAICLAAADVAGA